MAIIIQRSGNPLSHFGNVVGQAAMGYAQGLQQHQKAEKERKATEQISTLREMQIEKGEREQTATLAGGTALTAIDAGLGSNVFAITEHKDKPPTVELEPNLRAQLPFMDPQQEELLTEQLTLHTNNMESAWYEERVPDVIAQLNRVAGVGTAYARGACVAVARSGRGDRAACKQGRANAAGELPGLKRPAGPRKS